MQALENLEEMWYSVYQGVNFELPSYYQSYWYLPPPL